MNTRNKAVTTPYFIYYKMAMNVTDMTPPNALSYNITIRELNQPWQSYNLRVKPIVS